MQVDLFFDVFSDVLFQYSDVSGQTPLRLSKILEVYSYENTKKDFSIVCQNLIGLFVNPKPISYFFGL